MFFLDSANLSEIKIVLDRGLASGITTNPTLLMNECSQDPLKHIKSIVDMLNTYSLDLPLSVQVMANNAKEIRDQALRIRDYINYENLVVKIPIGWDELAVIYTLSKDNISINCTCCMTEVQVALAASAGAEYISVFYGKASDDGIDPNMLVCNSVSLLNKFSSHSKLIVGSLRTPWAVTEIIRQGADIITVPYEFFERLVCNAKTTEAISLFKNDYPNKPWI